MGVVLFVPRALGRQHGNRSGFICARLGHPAWAEGLLPDPGRSHEDGAGLSAQHWTVPAAQGEAQLGTQRPHSAPRSPRPGAWHGFRGTGEARETRGTGEAREMRDRAWPLSGRPGGGTGDVGSVGYRRPLLGPGGRSRCTLKRKEKSSVRFYFLSTIKSLIAFAIWKISIQSPY